MMTTFSAPMTRFSHCQTMPTYGRSSARGSLPHMAPATARSVKPRPMVSISTAKCGSPIMGRSNTRSSRAPTTAMTSTAAKRPSAKGQSRRLMKTTAMKAPIIMISPWAKLTISVAL